MTQLPGSCAAAVISIGRLVCGPRPVFQGKLVHYKCIFKVRALGLRLPEGGRKRPHMPGACGGTWHGGYQDLPGQFSHFTLSTILHVYPVGFSGIHYDKNRYPHLLMPGPVRFLAPRAELSQ
jgi:hypothetical protein